MDSKKILDSQSSLRINRVDDIEKIRQAKKDFVLPVEVRIKKIKEAQGYKIFLVDGDIIRDLIDVDFTMGGHGYRYVYVPENEIWIDEDNQDEKEAIILHELTEVELMKNGMDYDHAHDLSSQKEIELRRKELLLKVGHHRQINPWSCGPSALKIVLDFYQDRKPISKLIKDTGASPKYPTEGTLHSGFEKALEKYGYKFLAKNNGTTEEIEEFIQQGIPVIVDYQAYHGGHFAAVIGYDEKYFILSDPASDKMYTKIKKPDFDKRWFGEDNPREIIQKWLLAIYRKK